MTSEEKPTDLLRFSCFINFESRSGYISERKGSGDDEKANDCLVASIKELVRVGVIALGDAAVMQAVGDAVADAHHGIQTAREYTERKRNERK